MRFGRVILVFACVAAIDFAVAASQKDYDNCNSFDPDRRIQGCTIVIQDPKESQKNHAIANYQRGLGYERKGEFGAAIADFNEAIKLKIEGDQASKRRDYVSKKKDAIDRAALGSVDGTWEGELRYKDKDGNAKSMWRRIVIDGSDAKVFYETDGKHTEVKPGAFRVQRHLANAVVVSIDSALDDDGLWIETWSFVVTLKERNTLIANFTRLVNNANLPLSTAHSKFAFEASGELQRK